MLGVFGVSSISIMHRSMKKVANAVVILTTSFATL